MSKPLVVFGAGAIAELAWFYFKHDSAREVAAFTVDRAFLESDTFHALPLVAFEDLEQRFPPSDYDMFIALSYAKRNSIRAAKYGEAKAKGYALASYVSTRASVFPDAVHGDNCFILEDNTVQPFVRIGSNVTLWSGNHIGHHSTIRDHCFVSSHVVVSGGVEIGEACFLGVNSTLRDHINLGARTVVGAGALILHSTEPGSVYVAAATTPSSKA